MATFIQEGVYLDHTPVSALSQGDVVAIEDDFFGVATSAIAAGVQGALAVQGIFEFVSDGVIAAGALVYWNSETSKVSATPADDCYIGRAVAAAAGNLCRVALNASNIGEFIAIVPASAPTATQSAVSAFTAANPAAITAANPAAVTAADPTVVDPTTDTITGNDYTGQAAIIKLAIEANNTAIKAVEAELVKAIADVTAVRAEVVKLVTDVTAIRAEVVKAVTDFGTTKTALNAAKTDIAAVVSACTNAGVLE